MLLNQGTHCSTFFLLTVAIPLVFRVAIVDVSRQRAFSSDSAFIFLKSSYKARYKAAR